jgi:predicted aconitase
VGLIRKILGCALLAAMTGVAVQAILLLHEATRATMALPVAVSAELQATRAALVGEIAATRRDLTSQVEVARKDLLARADGQATALQANAVQQIGNIRSLVDRRLGDTLARVDTALGIVEGVRADLKPVLDGAAALEADTDKTVTDLHPQLLGLVAAGKVTAGEAATTMREIQRATPEIVASVKGAAEHIDAATEASATASANAAAVTGNLAAATKPLPRAVRVGLQIGGPVAQITSYVILMLSTMGVL